MQRAQPLLGTLVEISIADAGADACAMAAAFAAVARVHALMSFHEPDSDLSQLNHAAAGETVTVHPWTRAVLHAACRLHALSDGRFDCTVAHELQHWQLLPGTPGDRSLTGGMGDIEWLADGRIRLRRPLRLDLGGIAKGFAVDMAIHALRRHGVREAVVNAGGDLRVLGTRPQLIHVRSPEDPQQLIPLGYLAQGALATSGIYYSATIMAGRQVSALVDAGSRQPLTRPRSYSVLARTCMVADALTKVLAQHGDPDCAVMQRLGARGIVL